MTDSIEISTLTLDGRDLINLQDTRKPVAIILPCRNSGNSLIITIESILRNIQYPYKLFIIESESKDGTNIVCDNLANAHPDKIEVHHIKAEGTTCAINYGIRCARDMDVLLTQDDVIFHRFLGRDLLYEFVEISKIKEFGIATVDNGGGVSGPMYSDGLRWVGTWCMFIPRKTIDKIGLFDEMYNPGDGDDIDYTMKVISAGLKICKSDLFVEHHRRFSIEQHEHESQKIKERNSRYFKEKWKLEKLPKIVTLTFNSVSRQFDRFTLLDEGYQIDKLGYVHHDKEVFDMITRIVKRFRDDDIMIDVGAGVGDTCIWHDRGTSFAFEPSGRCYQHILTNIKLNPNSHVVPIMVAVYSSPVHYEVKEGKHYGLDSIELTDDETKPQAIVLDDMFKNVHNIRLIKIDAEGADLEVLKGAINIIKKNKPVVIVEIDHTDKTQVEKILIDLNYDITTSSTVNVIGIPK